MTVQFLMGIYLRLISLLKKNQKKPHGLMETLKDGENPPCAVASGMVSV